MSPLPLPLPAVQSISNQNFIRNFKEVFGNEPDMDSSTAQAINKWRILGPITLQMVAEHSEVPLDDSIPLTLSDYGTGIVGQQTCPPVGSNSPDPMTCTGLGRECEFGIYEGQYVDDEWNGFGRRIIANGDFYLGEWRDGMRNGYGRYIYNAALNASFSLISNSQQPPEPPKQLVVEEGEWFEDEFRGEPREITPEEFLDIVKMPLIK